MQKWEELILVVPTEDVFAHVPRETCVFAGEEDLTNIQRVLQNELRIMRRGDLKDPTDPEQNAERNEAYRQLIPYVVIRQGDKVFRYVRIGGEARLVGQASIGVGGHMNPVQGKDLALDYDAILTENLMRELDEELHMQVGEATIRLIGVINDEMNPVGRVHLGLLYEMTLCDASTVSVKETDALIGEFVTLKEVKMGTALESWSSLALDVL